MSETVGLALFLGKTKENGSIPPLRAKRIIKAYLMEHPATKFSYDTLRPLVPGCVGKQFTNVMTEIKLMPDFNGGYATAEYVGPRREVLQHALPDRVLEGTHEAEVYLAIKGGNNTLDELKRRFGSGVVKVAYRLKRKEVIGSNGRGEYETNEATHGQNGINERAKAGAVTSALLDYLQENASEHPIPNAQIIGALTLQGFNKGSINARLVELKNSGLTTGERGMTRYAGRDGQAETRYSGKVKSIGDVFEECPELRQRVGSSPYNSALISARNSLPPDKVRLFYAALLEIPVDDAQQGARLEDFLPLAETPNSYGFMEWVAGQSRLSGQQFDRELSRYTRIGPRYRRSSDSGIF